MTQEAPEPAAEAVALDVCGLRKSYRRPGRVIEVLRGIDLRVARGDWVVLTGKSGCGKTTLLHLLGALDRPSDGAIRYFGVDVTKMGAFAVARWRRRTIGFIFQSYQLFPELTALENVALAGRLDGVGKVTYLRRANALLDRVGLSERSGHRPAELSGGEQQRIGVARALMNRPSIILADEPTGNLDDVNSREIMELLEALRKSEQLTVVMATHDTRLPVHADRVLRIEDGLLGG